MKRILMGVALTLTITISVEGQFNSGSSYFSAATRGKIGFTHQPNDLEYQQNSIQFGLSPEAGYFIKNRLALGGAILIDLNRTLGDLGFSEYSVLFGPSVRYYLPRDTEMQMFLYGFGGYGFVPSHQLLKIMLGPGINFFLTEKIAFEARVLYSLAREWNVAGGGHHHIHDVTFLAGISLFFSDLTFITKKGDLVE